MQEQLCHNDMFNSSLGTMKNQIEECCLLTQLDEAQDISFWNRKTCDSPGKVFSLCLLEFEGVKAK